MWSLRGNCAPNQKLACFVLYLKINNTFLKNNICILKTNCSRNSRMTLKFLVMGAVPPLKKCMSRSFKVYTHMLVPTTHIPHSCTFYMTSVNKFSTKLCGLIIWYWHHPCITSKLTYSCQAVVAYLTCQFLSSKWK